MYCLSFWVWFACINVVMPSFTHLPENEIISFFCLHRMSMSHFLYPFIGWWTAKLVVLNLGYCEECYIKHACTSVSVMCWHGVIELSHMIALVSIFYWETSMMSFLPTVYRIPLSPHQNLLFVSPNDSHSNYG